MRRMGGLRKAIPVTFLTMLIGCLGPSAAFRRSRAFSPKDEILSHVYEHNKLMWAIGVFTSFLTAFYMFRLLFLTFFGEVPGHRGAAPPPARVAGQHDAAAHRAGQFSSTVGRASWARPCSSAANHYLSDYLDPIFTYSHRVMPAASSAELSHGTELMLIGISVGVALAGLIPGLRALHQPAPSAPPRRSRSAPAVDSLVYHKYYVDELYNAVFVKPTMALSKGLYKFVENGVINPITNGVGRATLAGGQLLRFVQTGSVETYLILMVLGIVLILGLNFGRL